MAPAVKVVGVGPGSRDYITNAALNAVQEAQALVGGRRLLQEFASPQQDQYELRGEMSAALDYIRVQMAEKQVAVLVSGDTGIFSFSAYLRRHLSASELEFIPGISSFQLLFARIQKSWAGAVFFNVHGRMPDYLSQAVQEEEISVLFTGGKWSPPAIAGHLLEAGVADLPAVVGKDLGYIDEEILWTDLASLAVSNKSWNNSLLVIFNE